MNPLRPILWGLGLLLFIVGAYMLYFEAGLNRWISLGVLTAGLVLVAGLVVMSFASSTPAYPETVVHDRAERPARRDAVREERRPVEQRPAGYDARDPHQPETHDRSHQGTQRQGPGRTRHDH